MPPSTEQTQIDIRQYIGILFFRWHIIAVCFLYCLLGGVLYIQFTPPKYSASCRLDISRDPLLTLNRAAEIWISSRKHAQMLQASYTRDDAVKALSQEWGPKVGSHRKLSLKINARLDRASKNRIAVSVVSENPDYGKAFLTTVMKQHEARWERRQRWGMDQSVKMLTREMANIEEMISETEDSIMRFKKLHDLTRGQARGEAESGYVRSLVSQRRSLSTQMMMMEAENEFLKDANASVISQVGKLTRDTVSASLAELAAITGENDDSTGKAEAKNEEVSEEEEEWQRGWQSLRYRLVKLQEREKRLAVDLKSDNPTLMAVRREINSIQSQLDVGAEMQRRNLMDRYVSLQITLDAVEAAEFRWTEKYFELIHQQAELNRIQKQLSRYEGNYDTLFNRLHDLRVTETMKAERFSASGVSTGSKPTWPDPMKVLLVALAMGLASGFGLALLVQVLDNKIQSIKDVEKDLGIPFLGGVPYWVHSGLETAIRPIVTEEHSTGAIEAYRALSTSVIAGLDKMNEKVVLVTSADSREGKTLTTLNLAIIVARMNKKVLLIDLDLRRGRLHRSLGIDKDPGVSDVLMKKVLVRGAITGTRVEGLDMIATGSGTEETAELLQSSSLREIFDDVLDDYDYVFADTSPVLRVTDTVIMATQQLGAILYVARVNHTPKPLIRYSLDMLKDSRVLGLIMNSIEMHKISSLYYAYQYPNYAYYSNAYAYGYGYYYYGDKADKKKKQLRRGRGRSDGRGGVGKWLRRTFLPVE